MAENDYRIEMIESAPFQELTYVLWRKGQPEAIVVDPGFDVPSILHLLRMQNLQLAAILNTHGHADHIAGNADLKRAFPDAPLLIGVNEAHLLSDPMANLSGQFGVGFTSPAADRLLSDGEFLDVAGFRFEVREIPGHSPGSVVFIAHDYDPPFVLGGDVLFNGSVGRTDFPGGSGRKLLTGIREKLFKLPDATLVFPGHGPMTTIGAEKSSNPYLS